MTANRTVSTVKGRRQTLLLAALALTLLLGTMAVGIVLSEKQGRERLLNNLRARAGTSAQFLSSYISEQAGRQIQTAHHFLSGTHIPNTGFESILDTFGSDAGVLLDDRGRLLNVVPSDRAIIGSAIASRYAYLTAAEQGRVAVSGVVASAARGLPVVAIATPFETLAGRRVFSVAYGISSTVLNSFVDQTIAYSQHRVFLVDPHGQVIASSPRAHALSLSAIDPALTRALTKGSSGRLTDDDGPSTFMVSPVAGTSWRLVIEVSDSKLFASVNGWSQWVPWMVFALVTVLALVLLVLFSGFLADRARLVELSQEMADLAQTDSVTGLANRRSLTEQLDHAVAQANRYKQSLSLLMVDLDHFKQINDDHGHSVGDDVLRAVADCMREVFRSSDIHGRWGGDEFVAALPCTEEEGALIVAQRLCDCVEELDLSSIGVSGGISISVGCATGYHLTAHDLMTQADESLYRAKRAGRNQVVHG